MSRRANEPYFLPAARQDIADGFAWYEQQSLGLGREFVRCVEATVVSIQRHPEMSPAVLANYRRALVRKFPYVVFYEAEPYAAGSREFCEDRSGGKGLSAQHLRRLT